MSVKVMAWVWDQELPTSKKMLLLAIADHCDDDGDNAWPSKARLAEKVCLSEDRVRVMLRQLENEGWITTHQSQGGTRQTPTDRRPNLYRINMTRGRVGKPSRGRVDKRSRGRVGKPRIILSTSDTSLGSTSRAKERDELFDALVEVCEIDAERLTQSARGALNRATKELKEVSADVESVRRVAKAYRVKYPGASLTPVALSKHYPALATDQRRRDESRAVSGEVCEACQGTGWAEVDESTRTVVRCEVCSGAGTVVVDSMTSH